MFRQKTFIDNFYNFQRTPDQFDNFTEYVLPFGTITLYMIFIFVAPKVLTYKEKNLKTLSFYWNMFLCVWSWLMHFGAAVPFYYRLSKVGLMRSITDDVFGIYVKESEIPHVLVVMYKWAVINFVFSKFAELFDTVLLILKKPNRNFMKMPLFLHWYHHVTVLVFTYYCLYYWFPAGQIFLLMNSTIHGFMYYYYAMTCIGKKPTWDRWLTTGQTTQMFFGIAVVLLWFYNYISGGQEYCVKPIFMAVYCLIMYGSYLYMFVQLYIMKYINKKT